MIVDDEGVNMPQGTVPVGMPVLLRSLPALMLVLMMLVVNMQMFVVFRIVCVRDLDWIRLRPKGQSESASHENNCDHHGKGR